MDIIDIKYTDYTLTELINGRRPTFRGVVTAGAQSAMFSGFLVALKPMRNALQGLFTKGIKPSTTSRQPHVDGPKKGPESIGKTDDFAKEPFLPDEYYQKIDSYLKKAIASRNAEVVRYNH